VLTQLKIPVQPIGSPGPVPTVYFQTYGCQMNVLDTELVAGQLSALGYRIVRDPAEAGIIILNTCSVRALCEQKVWSYLGRLGLTREANPDRIIGVIGCMAEREGENIFTRVPFVDVLCGPSQLDRLPSLLENARRTRTHQSGLSGHVNRRGSTVQRAQDSLEGLDQARFASAVPSGFSAYVRITRGCNKFCSFCVVPYTRGPELHRSSASIIEEIKRLVGRGVKEVTLLGQTINHWVHQDGGTTESFADLLGAIHDQIPDLPRLRFLTSYPRDFSDAALDVMAQCPRICRYLHVPGQSGSNPVLKRMNRGYTVEQYEEFLGRARAKMPDICLAGDMIVGFPGETDADHQASLDLLGRIRLKSCYVFKYSPRPNTVAIRRLPDDVPEARKKARNQEMLGLQADIGRSLMERHLGKALRVLVEGRNKLTAESLQTRLMGRTAGDEIVAFEGPESLIGSFVQVRGLRVTPLTVFGELLAAS
jgi:tRNA-2-methylthio-N6-dimethylallyladenosine synthase